MRARRGESERAMTLALTAVMTAISAVHQKAARALLRFRKLSRAGRHDLLAIVKMPPPFSPTRPRSRATSCGRPIRTYVGTVLPARQPQKTNWCHGLTAESANCRPVGQHHCAAENGRSVSFFPLWPPFYDPDGPGEAWNGSGRPRWASLRPDGVRTVPTARERNPRGRKGVKSTTATARGCCPSCIEGPEERRRPVHERHVFLRRRRWIRERAI